MRDHATHGMGPPLGHDDGEGDRKGGRQSEFQDVQLAMRQAAHHRQDKQSEHIVDDRGSQNDLARDGMQQSLGRQHLCRDPDAGGHHGGADENGFVRRRAPEDQNSPPHQEWNYHTRAGYQRGGPAHFHQLG